MNPNNIEQYRKIAKLSQKELAERLGVGLGTIQRYEQGLILPSLIQLTGIANVLGVPVELLFVIGENETMGAVIRRYRRSRGLTQEDLAERIGVQRPLISKYENDSIEPSLKRLRRIADVLEVPVGLLVNVKATASEKPERQERLVDLDWLIEQEESEYRRVQNQTENVWLRLLNEAVHLRFQQTLSDIST